MDRNKKHSFVLEPKHRVMQITETSAPLHALGWCSCPQQAPLLSVTMVGVWGCTLLGLCFPGFFFYHCFRTAHRNVGISLLHQASYLAPVLCFWHCLGPVFNYSFFGGIFLLLKSLSIAGACRHCHPSWCNCIPVLCQPLPPLVFNLSFLFYI